MNGLLKDTNDYWQHWIGRSTYQGNWRESVHRSALALKLLIFEPTGMYSLLENYFINSIIGYVLYRIRQIHLTRLVLSWRRQHSRCRSLSVALVTGMYLYLRSTRSNGEK